MIVPTQIIITLNEKGQVNVEGPLDNKILFLGLLEAAKLVCNNSVVTQIIPNNIKMAKA